MLPALGLGVCYLPARRGRSRFVVKASAMTERVPQKPDDPVADASRLAAERDEMRRKDAEPSLGRRLGQIGVLGWAIVLPALAGLFLGRWLDRTYSTGVFFSAPMVMIGAGVGFWLAWKWMSRQ